MPKQPLHSLEINLAWELVDGWVLAMKLKTGSIVGDADPIPELIETMGHTGESVLGPALMDEFVPEEVELVERREDEP
jgi:hypothetical protein